MQLTLVIPAANCAGSLRPAVESALAFLKKRWPHDFEIILVPNGPEGAALTATLLAAQALAAEHPECRVEKHVGVPGKGAALKSGFLASKGRFVLFTDADLPYNLVFFDEAIPLLEKDFALVSGNRRLPQSRFNIPTITLRLAYRRHRLGLLFNSVVRFLFPVTTRDTQAGIKAMTRDLATLVFNRQVCTGFLFDIEIFLTCHAHGLKNRDLAVELFLENEKSTVRIFKESFSCLYWFWKIKKLFSNGHYGPEGKS